VSTLNKYGEIEDGGCHHCGNPIKPDWIACPECGNRLSVASADLKNCPACGKSIKPDWKACPSCGHSFINHHAPSRSTQKVSEARTLLKRLEHLAGELSAIDVRLEQALDATENLQDEAYMEMEERLGVSDAIRQIKTLIDEAQHVSSDIEAALGMSVQESKELTKQLELLKWSNEGIRARIDLYRRRMER
jgi:RNA polymerase subunit RPABC4/transcription elongation factor Spt4